MSEDEHVFESTLLTLFSACIIVLCFIVYFLETFKLHFIPESIVTIGLGALLSGVMKLSTSAGVHSEGSSYFDALHFNSELFFLILLPPIMFEGGYSLDKVHFFRNIVSIIVFAVFGTIISTFIVGVGLALLGHFGIITGVSFIDNMIYGALISAVDPVATLAIFNALHVSPMLHMMVFGESVLNDAVSIVLFRTFTNFKSTPFSAAVLVLAMGQFLIISVGSVLLGTVVGLANAFLFRVLDFSHRPILEVVLVISIAYMSYFISEALDLSGIMTILMISIIANHYTSYSMSDSSKKTLAEVSQALSFVCESAVFAYLGASVFAFEHTFSITYVVATIALCMIGRAANVFPLTALLNLFRTYRTPQKFQFIQFWSGLRGAVAFALVLSITGSSANMLVTTTLTVVLFTVIIFGGSTLPMLKVLKVHDVKTEPKEKLYETILRSNKRVSAYLARLGLLSQQSLMRNAASGVQPDEFKSSFETFDERYMQPLFRKSTPLGPALSAIVNRMARRRLQAAPSVAKRGVPSIDVVGGDILGDGDQYGPISGEGGAVELEAEAGAKFMPHGAPPLIQESSGDFADIKFDLE
ncbi:Na+/H+ exchanger [Carpediemonas membranifera]|uniref:Sodium/hydrogen exchanger n=1 Tax=Carpediemonas membranifera TaxID=201153 RepID=A0A8J6AW52_9EUKA|nr:Na+/H+ exchanger [Carpediemonas membranifera]|eukprot:KAG9395668.1 Na+/H+ exchanger [Carpediemonas membranifera]